MSKHIIISFSAAAGALLIVLAYTSAFSQPLQWQWAINNGSTLKIERCIAQQTDKNNNIIAMEKYLDQEEVDSVHGVKLTKYDPSGKVIWRKVISCYQKDRNVFAAGICIDSLDNIYCYLIGDTAFYVGAELWASGISNSSTAAIIKISSAGMTLWSRNFSGQVGPQYQYADKLLAIDHSNNLIVGGRLMTPLEIQGHRYAENTDKYNFFIIKFDESGNVLFAQCADSIFHNFLYYDGLIAVSTDQENNILVCGSFSDTLLWGTTRLQSAGDYDSFIAKLSPIGEVLWMNRIGGKYDDYGAAITSDTASNIYVSCTVKDNITVGRDVETQVHIDGDGQAIFLTKLTPYGKLEWFKTIPHSYSNIYATGMEAQYDKTSNNIVYTFFAEMNFTLDSMAIDILPDGNDVLCSISSSGTLSWIMPLMEYQLSFYLTSFCLSNNGAYYVGGTVGYGSDSTFYIDSTIITTQVGKDLLTTHGGYDSFIGKLSAAPSAVKNFHYSSLTTTAYPNPFTDRTTISLPASTTEPVTVQLYNSLGVKVLEQHYPAGANSLSLSRTGLPAGVYHYNISSLRGTITTGEVIAQ